MTVTRVEGDARQLTAEEYRKVRIDDNMLCRIPLGRQNRCGNRFLSLSTQRCFACQSNGSAVLIITND